MINQKSNNFWALSLRPEYWQEIKDGEKHHEFRRRGYVVETGTVFVVYVTRPVKAVCGLFMAGEVIIGEPRKTLESLGYEYSDYWDGCPSGTVIEIKEYRAIEPRSVWFRPPLGLIRLSYVPDDIRCALMPSE